MEHLDAYKNRNASERDLKTVATRARGYDSSCTNTYTFADGSRLEVNKWDHRNVRGALSDFCLWSN